MLTCLYQIVGDCCLPKRLAGLQPMQSFNHDKAIAIRPRKNGGFLSLLHQALCKGFNLLRI
jgi:hypothetical protein